MDCRHVSFPLSQTDGVEYSNEPVEEVLICRDMSSSGRLFVYSNKQSCSIGYRHHCTSELQKAEAFVVCKVAFM